jgi:acyl carrier protein
LFKDVAQQGFGSIAPAQAVNILEQLMQQDLPQVTVVDLDLQRLRQVTTSAKIPFLSDLIPDAPQNVQAKDSGRVDRREEKSSIRTAISGADPAARRRLLQNYLSEEMAKILQLPPSDLSMNRPLNSLGIDSLMAVEMRNRIESDLPVRVQISSLLEGSSADDLVRNILNQLQPEASGNASPRVARVKQEIDQMSDEAVRALLDAKRQAADRRRSSS